MISCGDDGDDRSVRPGRPADRKLLGTRIATLIGWLVLVAVDGTYFNSVGHHVPHYWTFLAVLITATSLVGLDWVRRAVLTSQADLRGRVDVAVDGQADLRRRFSSLRAEFDEARPIDADAYARGYADGITRKPLPPYAR